jgi:ectoine hydroxylase-related dioxygenase (phytanoyl-CoA dioxygenase family)
VTHSKTFRTEIIDHDKVHELAHAILSPTCETYWMGTAQVIEIGPGNKAQTLHRDFENYMAFKPFGKLAPDVICNFLIALTPFTEENGATRVIPGSQNWDDYEDRGSQDMTVPALLEPGDALFFTGKIVHGGGANVTKDSKRRAVAFTFNPGWLVPEEAYPFVVNMDLARTLSPRVQQCLGFRSFRADMFGLPGLWQINYEEIADYIGLDKKS